MTQGLPILTLMTPQGDRRIETTAEDSGEPLSRVLRRHGLPLNTRCGERGLCNGCHVTVNQGQLYHLDDKQTVGPAPLPVCGCRLTMTDGPATLEIDAQSLRHFEAHAVNDFVIDLPHAHDPLLDESDAKQLSNDSDASPLGAAIDIGTTTVAVLLVDLHNGEPLARTGAFNKQVDFGDNVLTRINRCMNDKAAITEMQKAVVQDTIAPLLDSALKQAEVRADRLRTITVAGNTTMLHLLRGMDPTSMGVAPFTPLFTEYHRVTPQDLALRLGSYDDTPGAFPEAAIHLLPSAAAYVGADITAGVVATGMRYHTGTALLVDVGTNGEIVLAHKGKLTACATAAGPAFEGGGLMDGMHAGDGAIGSLRLTGDPPRFRAQTLGKAKPLGICGSAYVDALALGRACGVITPSGRFDPERFAGPIAGPDAEGGYRCLSVAKANGGKVIGVSEPDVAMLMQAKAAIAAGILTLLDRMGLQPSDVDTLFLAGGFGRHVNIPHAIACGLLPGFVLEQIEAVGNLSLGGAFLALLDRSLLTEMSEVTSLMDTIELNTDPGFEDRYIDQLELP